MEEAGRREIAGEWKKQVKEKLGKLIESRAKQETKNKTKARAIAEDKWERKKDLQQCDNEIMQVVIKIRLYMWQVNYNYNRDNTGTKCTLCKKPEDATEHVLKFEKANKFTLCKESSEGEWEKKEERKSEEQEKYRRRQAKNKSRKHLRKKVEDR